MVAHLASLGSIRRVLVRGTRFARARSMRRGAIRILGLCFLALAALLVLVYVLRDPLATRATALYLEHAPGLQCDAPQVTIARGLDTIHISPLACTREEGPMRRFAAHSGIEVSLRGLSVERVHLAAAEVELRDRDVSHVQMASLGSELSKVVGLADALVKGNLDSHAMYANDSPPVVIDRLRVLRAGKQEATLLGFEKSTDGRWDRSYARKVDVPGAGGLVSIQAFDLRVTRSRAQTTAAVFLGGRPKPGAKPDIKLQVEGARLESDAPRFDVDLGT